MPTTSGNEADAKALLRRELRQRRRALDTTAQAQAAAAVACHIDRLPGWSALRHIALYRAADGELDPADIARRCRDEGRTLYLPRLADGGRLLFSRWTTDGELAPNRYGILEPVASALAREPRDLDLILLPLVGWDRRGRRLGMGGGFYDRTLAGARPSLLVGLAHDLQEVPRLPEAAWDISMDYVLTGGGLHRCRGLGPKDGDG
ncbi:MAG: 5-formyltetrahydrofolate cyclo-ligase [Parahaliea sp.]